VRYAERARRESKRYRDDVNVMEYMAYEVFKKCCAGDQSIMVNEP